MLGFDSHALPPISCLIFFVISAPYLICYPTQNPLNIYDKYTTHSSGINKEGYDVKLWVSL